MVRAGTTTGSSLVCLGVTVIKTLSGRGAAPPFGDAEVATMSETTSAATGRCFSGPLAEQLDLHRQLPDVPLRRVEHLRHGLAVTVL